MTQVFHFSKLIRKIENCQHETETMISHFNIRIYQAIPLPREKIAHRLPSLIGNILFVMSVTKLEYAIKYTVNIIQRTQYII